MRISFPLFMRNMSRKYQKPAYIKSCRNGSLIYSLILLSGLVVFLLIHSGCHAQKVESTHRSFQSGSERMEQYLSRCKNKKVGVVANHTSMVGRQHLVDTLKALGVNIQLVFAPEHGFRGEAEAGEHVADGVDKRTGVRVVSLYGSKKKPAQKDMAELDLVLFDIQDVGVRFYTYISTLQYVMEACSDRLIPLILLDRPNPNADYVDGPVLETSYRSFVGMQPVPIVYGMTIGEYGLMLNGEGWLSNGVKCDLTVVTCQGWDRSERVHLPVPPSPNLPNDQAIRLYPSLCLFEGTAVSLGRGTPLPFQCYGFPGNKGLYTFTPEDIPGKAVNPPYEGRECRGEDLSGYNVHKLDTSLSLEWLIKAYSNFNSTDFFNDFFNKLAGTDKLRKQIEQGWSEGRIRDSWQYAKGEFMQIRKKYLIY